MLKENLKTVEERIQSACKKAGRKREEITLDRRKQNEASSYASRSLRSRSAESSARTKFRKFVKSMKSCQKTLIGI